MIRIDRLHFRVGTFALKDFSLEIPSGEYFVLLGPSGSGKTLLLESLCGLNRIDSGQIEIDGVDVTRLEPRLRGIGYLPQDYALFPDKTVRGNIGFGLKSISRSSRRELVDELMVLTETAPLADRLPSNLSGGEKQRVALARALAIRPRVLLLDEPVSALDERTRDTFCRQLKRLHHKIGTTAMHVCHNFAEMLAVADRVGVVHGGRILQVGTPEEVLERPRNRFVASFVQAGNVFRGRVESDGSWLRLICSEEVMFHAPRSPRDASPVGSQRHFVVRPENVQLVVNESSDPKTYPTGTTFFKGILREVVNLGPLVRLAVDLGGRFEIIASLGKRTYNQGNLAVGDHVPLAVAPQDVHVLED